MYFVLKCLLSGLIVGIVSEIARRSSTFAAVVASLPLTSILAFIWIYHESKDLSALSKLSLEIALIVLPSILFFVLFYFLIRLGWSFYPSLISSLVGLGLSYWIYSIVLRKVGIII
jgi:hypothetical protein